MHQNNTRGRLPGRTAVIAKRFLPLVCAAMLSACSSTPDWINPVAWFDNAFEDDLQDLPAASPEAKARVAEARAKQSGNSSFPQLRQVPERPEAPSNAAERQQINRGLVADRDNARYTDQQLRAGTAQASPPQNRAPGSTLSTLAPPPPPRAVAQAQQVQRAAPAAPANTVAAPAPRTAPARPSPPSSIVSGSNYQVPSIVQRRTPPAAAPPPPVAPRVGTPVPAAPTSPPVAAAGTPPVGGALAPVAPPPPTGVPSNPAATIAATPNPALNTAPRPAYRSTPVPPVPAQQAFAQPAYGAAAATGYPAGTVVIGGSGVSAASYQITGTGYATAVPAQGATPFTVYFGHGSSKPSAKSTATLRSAAQAAKQRNGVVRVVGHASQRTGNMRYRKHVTTNFNVSLDRAENVARALARLGIDRRRIIVEARGDTEPIYYEFMPTGEARNRRAEIYIE